MERPSSINLTSPGLQSNDQMKFRILQSRGSVDPTLSKTLDISKNIINFKTNKLNDIANRKADFHMQFQKEIN